MAEFPLPAALEKFSPHTALVLGSGLGAFCDQVPIRASFSYQEIPGLPVSTVPGHAGRLLLAEVAGQTWALFQGRVHLYEGRPAKEVTANVRLANALGCKRIILTNAAGTLNPDFPPGSWMQITDHLNLTGTTPLLGGAHFVDMTQAYSAKLQAEFQQKASTCGVTLHQGVYAGLLGPQYETPAEIRMLRTLGADAVGMSTVLETVQARALGMETAGFSCLTNWAAGITGQALHHAEVMETGHKAAAQLCRILLA
jgi:purine-nucleoside phosphorylase